MTESDIVFAFFPCTMFQENNNLWFRGLASQQKNWSDEKKLQFNIDRHETLHEFYTLLCQMVIIAKRKNLKMIIENPYTSPHYLTMYWCIEPSLIDKDRRTRGDHFYKPTQYWFINCEPKSNFIWEPLEEVEIKKILKTRKKDGISSQVQRSMIAPQYANRFIREFILDETMRKATSGL